MDELGLTIPPVTTAAPTGPAGGVLAGTYPNPSFAVDMATQAELDAKVEDSIVDGHTTIAPSGNAVFDALALKVPTSRTVNGHALSADVTVTASDLSLGNVDNTSDATKNAATVTLTNKRVTERVVSMTDATSFTPTGDSADINTQANTQALGVLTANAPSGTPTDGQRLIIRIKSTNVQTFSWNGIYRGSVDIPLPATTTGATKTDYYGFQYNGDDTVWDLLALTQGF